MTVDVADDLIEIQDPEIDPAQILEKIRERIKERRESLGHEQPLFPTFGANGYPGEPADIPYDPDLYFHLRLVNENYAEADRKPILVSSPLTRLPIIGSLWQLVRAQVHNLARFYVNRAVARQIEVNRHLVNVLNRLVALNQEQQRTIAALQADLEAVRQQEKK